MPRPEVEGWDVVELGEARAAEIHLRQTPAAGHDRDHDFGL